MTKNGKIKKVVAGLAVACVAAGLLALLVVKAKRDRLPQRTTMNSTSIDLPVSQARRDGWTLVETDSSGAVLYDMRTLKKQEDGTATVLIKKIYTKEGHDALGPGLGGTLYSLILNSFDCGSWESAVLNLKYAGGDGSVIYDSGDYGRTKERLSRYTPVEEGGPKGKIAEAVCSRVPERPRGSAPKRYVESPVPAKPPWSYDTLCEQLEKTGSTASFKVKVGGKLPEYRFTIAGRFIKEGVFNPTHIDVADTATNRRIQRIMAGKRFGKGAWDGYIGERCPAFQFVDLNYDGYLDMRVLNVAGATGLDWYATFLYSPRSGTFVYHPKLSTLPYVTPDPGSKRIISYDRSGYCDECRGHIRILKDGRLLLEKVEWTDPGRDNLDNIICYAVTATPRDNAGVYLPDNTPACPLDEDGIRAFKRKFKIVRRELMEGSLDARDRGPLGNPAR